MLSFSDLFGPSTWTRVNRPSNSRTHIFAREIDRFPVRAVEIFSNFSVIFSNIFSNPPAGLICARKRPPYGSDRFARDGLSRSNIKKGLAGRASEQIGVSTVLSTTYRHRARAHLTAAPAGAERGEDRIEVPEPYALRLGPGFLAPRGQTDLARRSARFSPKLTD